MNGSQCAKLDAYLVDGSNATRIVAIGGGTKAKVIDIRNSEEDPIRTCPDLARPPVTANSPIGGFYDDTPFICVGIYCYRYFYQNSSWIKTAPLGRLLVLKFEYCCILTSLFLQLMPFPVKVNKYHGTMTQCG